MNRIIKIGMDVHTTNYTLCIFEPSFEHDGTVHCITQVKPEVKNIIHVIHVIETEAAVKGDTATGATKYATIETGYQIKVPLFIEEGEVVVVNTVEGKYSGRA